MSGEELTELREARIDFDDCLGVFLGEMESLGDGNWFGEDWTKRMFSIEFRLRGGVFSTE